VAQQQFVGGKFMFQPIDIGLPDRRLRAQQTDHAGLGHGGGGFDRGHGSDNRHLQHLAHTGQRNRAGRVAGNADKARAQAFGHPAQQARHARGNLRLGLCAIGQARIVRDIDHRRIGHMTAQRVQHGQPANAGIKQQYRAIRGNAGGRVEAMTKPL
jgi:hypothetical protein